MALPLPSVGPPAPAKRASPGRTLRPSPVAAVLASLFFATAAAAPSARVYQAIRGESTLAYRLEHPLHDVEGVSRDFVCKVELSPDTLSSRVEVSAEVKSFDSGNPNRDDHALEAIKARRHPRVEFVSDSVRRAGDGYEIYGKLSFAGRVRPVGFRVVPRKEGDRVRITGTFALKLSDFGVKRPSLMFIPARDRLDIRFDLVARDE